ncbi:hypothetical protein RHMOL_Rhmol02G0148000 [Rhododendron molle]|uniref:Uncharacterized protein n=1 Tax=Rhododendron molle TaxID=49168 RepID=A0ACC0PQA7_RHOML|nr:hypothetical protein RHMOL_Rhmol02G0148000 [Rhododendron molle]
MAKKLKPKVLVAVYKICYIYVQDQPCRLLCGTRCYNLPNFINSRSREGLSTKIPKPNQIISNQTQSPRPMDCSDTTCNAPSRQLYLNFESTSHTLVLDSWKSRISQNLNGRLKTFLL